MKKETAIQIGGGSVPALAALVGLAVHDVRNWPDDLPRTLADRVIAAQVRREWAAYWAAHPGARALPDKRDAVDIRDALSLSLTPVLSISP